MRSKKQNNLKKYDPNKTLFAHEVVFVDSDCEINKLENVSLRATHLFYLVGELIEEEGMKKFIDIASDNEFNKYLYFNSISDAMYNIPLEKYNEPFVLKATPIREIGIEKKYNKKDLLSKLNETNLLFNFKEDYKCSAKKIKKK